MTVLHKFVIILTNTFCAYFNFPASFTIKLLNTTSAAPLWGKFTQNRSLQIIYTVKASFLLVMSCHGKRIRIQPCLLTKKIKLNCRCFTSSSRCSSWLLTAASSMKLSSYVLGNSSND